MGPHRGKLTPPTIAAVEYISKVNMLSTSCRLKATFEEFTGFKIGQPLLIPAREL